MRSEDLRVAFKAFFDESEPGRFYTEALKNLITTNHESAEKDPDHARDFVQRAKGAREALNIILSIKADPGGKKPKQS